MEPKLFTCVSCGASRSSRFALKRHQRKEHEGITTTTTDSTSAALSRPCIEDTRKVTVTTRQTAKPRRRKHPPIRPAIDHIVHQLRARHRRRPTYFRKSSAEIADDLQRGARDHNLDRMVYLAIAVTARAFAGVKHQTAPCAVRRVRVMEPRQPCSVSIEPVITPTGIVHGARRRGRRGDRSLDPVRRILFRNPAPEVQQGENSVLKDVDEDWRLCIWQSYETQQIKPRSPMGFRWAPATIFASSSVTAPPVSPADADNVNWGPDSPLEPLEEDTVPEVPGWPMFKEDGELLLRDDPRWKARLLLWRNERTKTSPIRVEANSRRSCHMRCNQRVMVGAGPTFDDVRLPSPPSAGLASLLKLKRELVRSQYPVPIRRRPKRDKGTTTNRPTTRSTAPSMTQPPSIDPQHTPDIEICAPDELL